jgi:hypothetical protein
MAVLLPIVSVARLAAKPPPLRLRSGQACVRGYSFRARGRPYFRVSANFFRIEDWSEGGGQMDATISTKDLKNKLDKRQVTVVETLAPDRFREVHLPGALNIPREKVRELAPQLLPNKDSEIVTYCANTH